MRARAYAEAKFWMKGGWEMFRFRKSVPLSYDRQGYIYFCSRIYKMLQRKKQERIKQICREAGGEYHEALLEFVTGKLTAPEVCGKYFISQATLDRAVRRYYLSFPRDL